MKINLEETPIEFYPYLEVGSGQTNNGKPIILSKKLPIYFGDFESNKTSVDFLIICSDLQGMTERDGIYKLLGEELPEFLKLLIEVEFNSISNPKIGVLLCGDLFTNLDKRGASGDVRQVWIKFKEQFNWVVGVAGNHDQFGTVSELKTFKAMDDIFLLHKDVIEIDKLKIGGISGIIGRPDKSNRVEEKEYLQQLKVFLKKDLDILLLHETPDFPNLDYIGNPKIREVLDTYSKTNICCGHCHWDKTLVELENNSLIMNVDSKVVILKKRNNG